MFRHFLPSMIAKLVLKTKIFWLQMILREKIIYWDFGEWNQPKVLTNQKRVRVWRILLRLRVLPTTAYKDSNGKGKVGFVLAEKCWVSGKMLIETLMEVVEPVIMS